MIILILLFLAAAFILGDIIISENYLTVNRYEIENKKTDAEFRAVLLSDLHNREYGEDNADLLRKVSEQKPDVIFTTGDFVTKIYPQREVGIKLLKNLCGIAPVYSVLGNHELGYEDYDGLISDIKASGATLLDNDMAEVKVRGDVINVGGLTDFPYYEYNGPEYNNPEAVFLDKFIEGEKNRFSVLLVHQPECFMWGLDKKQIDLMLCGHTHGGIVRLPFLGGLFAPNQGLLGQDGILPKYTKGYYESDTARMIITGGLGNEVPVPRFNNPPEICVIDVVKK
jgi:predicted MPP superfamily phosphohydrolase